MTTLDLNQCDVACLGCIKTYKKKHELVEGNKFKILCNGIPDDYVSKDIRQTISKDEAEAAESILDPVTWARENLDWHCSDPEGEVWKRRNPQEYLGWVQRNPDESIEGKSRYHRPYQAEMLRCTSNWKVFRIGRQAGKTEALVVSMLYNLYTKPGLPENEGFKVVVIAPYQTQVELIFSRLRELINSSDELKNSVARDVKAPNYTIELKNGSTVKGFTAGTKSGGNADSVRGQHAHMLVFDEADLLSSGDIDSALAVVTNNPDATIWMSSTPTGKRGKFFGTCNSDLWREFHYSSHVNPMWTDKLDVLYKQQLTELAYKHEILAEFGEQAEGVFQNSYIQASKEDYNYSEMARDLTWIYTIGVDWNDVKNGTTISVIGFNPIENRFKIVCREKVQKTGWNQLSACKKIQDVNRIWRPIAIYLDAGHGGTQWEVLRKEGYDAVLDPTRGATHPDSKLRYVKQYEFGGTVETHDLFTRQKIKKPAKPFLVENAVRRFESNTIIFSKYDEELEKQLQNYIIERVNPSGIPVYKAREDTIGDHALDSVMLALVAFTLEETPFGKVIHRIDIGFTGNFGDRIDPVVSEGDTAVVDPRMRTKNKASQRAKPSMNRNAGVTESSSILGRDREIPANHMNSSRSEVKLWAWPGFGHDAPKPKVRTLSEAVNEAKDRKGINRFRGGRPRRKNI